MDKRPIINDALTVFGSNHSLHQIELMFPCIPYLDDAINLLEEWENNEKILDVVSVSTTNDKGATHEYQINECGCTIYLRIDEKEIHIIDILAEGISMAAGNPYFT